MRNVAHACTLVGVFENAEKAELAREDLMRDGFAAEDIRVQSEPVTFESREGSGFWDTIKELFGREEAYAYPDAERQGRHIVILNCSEDPDIIEKAAQIMRRFNPIDEFCNKGATMKAGRRPRID